MTDPKNLDLSTSLQMVDKILERLERIEKHLEILDKIISSTARRQPTPRKKNDDT